jgi:GT2 family glycosyltransferase
MVYFIIVTFNSVDLITGCIESILIHEQNSGIIIVDNNSEDGTVELIKGYRDVLLVENSENLGFGFANNLGIKLAIQKGADYVYLLNHDAYLIEPIVDKLISVLISNPEVGIISPFHLGASERMLERQFEKFMHQQGVMNKVYYDLISNRNSGCYEVDFIPAASWFMRVNLILSVGYFHKLFFHYGEDNNYLQRVKFWNYKIMITNELHIVHIGYEGKQNVVYNYSGYHELSFRANFLVRFLDVNQVFSTVKVIKDIFNNIYTLILLLLNMRFKSVINLFKIVIWKSKLVFILKKEHGCQKLIPTKYEI